MKSIIFCHSPRRMTSECTTAPPSTITRVNAARVELAEDALEVGAAVDRDDLQAGAVDARRVAGEEDRAAAVGEELRVRRHVAVAVEHDARPRRRRAVRGGA